MCLIVNEMLKDDRKMNNKGEMYELTPEVTSTFKELAGMIPTDRIARLLGIERRNFVRMIDNPEHPFSEAFEQARQRNHKNALAGIAEKVKDGNLDAIKYLLSRMGGWTEKQEIEVNSAEDEDLFDADVPIEDVLLGIRK